jgi:hypothetical protein
MAIVAGEEMWVSFHNNHDKEVGILTSMKGQKWNQGMGIYIFKRSLR